MQAADVYEFSVERYERPWSRPLRVVGQLVGAAVGLTTQPPSAGDLVVRRIADGDEVLRTAGDSVSVERLREALATQTAAEFRETWGISD